MRQLDEMLKMGFVRPNISMWRAPILLTGKKDVSQKLCTYYRKFDDVIIRNKDHFLIIADLFDQSGESIFKDRLLFKILSSYN